MDYSSTVRDEEYGSGVANTQIYRDDVYYFDDVIFLVETCLFKVPRRFFIQESEFFQQMFELPPPKSYSVDGLSDEQPLRLNGVAEHDFRRLLRLLYSDRSAFHENEEFTLDEWTSILKLSTMWVMTQVRDHTILQMTSLLASTPARKVSLGQQYHVDAWVMSGITALIRRSPPMGMDEIAELGVEAVLKIAAIRECVSRDNMYGEWSINSERGQAPATLRPADALPNRIRESFLAAEGSD